MKQNYCFHNVYFVFILCCYFFLKNLLFKTLQVHAFRQVLSVNMGLSTLNRLISSCGTGLCHELASYQFLIWSILSRDNIGVNLLYLIDAVCYFLQCRELTICHLLSSEYCFAFLFVRFWFLLVLMHVGRDNNLDLQLSWLGFTGF